MLKRSKILLILICLLLIVGCKKETDSEKFRKEYPNVSENNYFKYKTSEDIIKYIDSKGTFLLFIGSNIDEWSNNNVSSLDKESKKEGVSIYYIKIDDSESIFNKINLVKSSYLLGVVKGELKYSLNENNKLEEIEDAISKMAIEINSCDIHDDGC